MKTLSSLMLCLAAGAFYLVGSSAPAAGPLPTYRFDLGSSTSPVASGFTRVTPDAAYLAGSSYGWESRGQTSYDVEKPPDNPEWRQPAGQLIPEDLIIHKEHTDVTRDGVSSREDLQFRVDLPNGVYRVALTLGRLDRPVCSMQVFINGEEVARDFDARHWRSRARPDAQYGFPRRLRRTVTVRDGVLRLRVHGDDSGFRRRFDQEYDKPQPGSYLEGTYIGGVYRVGRSFGMDVFEGGVKPKRGDLSKWGSPGLGVYKVWVWEDIGGPFTENALSAIEIYPYNGRPLEWKDGKLAAATADPALRRGEAQFNAGRWADAESSFDSVRDPYARALGYLWLAGRPQYEEESRLLPKALEILNRLASGRGRDLVLHEDIEAARRMEKAIHRFVHRSAEQRAYNELIMVTGEVASMQPEDPLYYKSRIYAGRAMYMIIPHRWTYAAGVGRQMFEELARAGFGDNRFVRWFLRDEWSPRAPDWVFPDYTEKKRGAPRWAGEVFEAYNRELDLGEWWIRNRQSADGALGGGWGDDVEILRSIGSFASVCADASPVSMEGVRKVSDGAWNSGSIDTEAGYFAEVGDTEHSGEWTADTLTAMIRIDFGNPVYIERAMKTGKLMRDLWMDHTRNGLFIMRSNFLGATGVGGHGTTNESRINLRPASPARSVLWYNRLPALQKLFLDWAESWRAASMSTERGKPKGIVPSEIGYPSGTLGGERAPSWHEAEHLPGSVNSDWEGMGYIDFISDLLALAYELSGDAKYLEPLQLQAEFVRRHLPEAARDSVYVKSGRLHPSLWQGLTPGSDSWVAARLATWPQRWEAILRVLHPEESTARTESFPSDEIAAKAADENDGARRRWPHTTSEAMATDRIHFPNMGTALRTMTGFGTAGAFNLVSYRGLGREFAAALLRADAAGVKAVVFNIDTAPKTAGLVPWVLNTGDEFEFTAGPDADNDGRADRIDESRRFRVESTGQEIPFRVGGRSQVVVELRRVSQGQTKELMADLALSPADIQFRPDYGKIDVSVHNIGAAAARGVTVVLLDDQQKEIGRQLIPHIPAPVDLNPSVVRVGFAYDLSRAADRKFTAVVEPEGGMREITRVNNRAAAVCPAKLAQRRRHAEA